MPNFELNAPRATDLESTTVNSPLDARLALGEISRPARQNPWKSALRIVSFFLLFGALSAGLHTAINFGLRKIKVSKFGALNDVMSGKVNSEIIITGSSRALSHYDPRVVQNLTGRSAYNIGMNASQIDFELVILKTYLKHNNKPKLVIQNLDLFSFETTKKGDLYDPGYYLPYLNDPELYGFFHQMVPDAWKCKYIPLYGYAVEDMRFTWIWGLLGCCDIQGRQDYYLGFNPRAGTWNEDFEHFRLTNPNGVRYVIDPIGVRSLEEIISLCRRTGIEIILVYSPEYIEMQSLETNREEIMARFHEISERFNVPFWDYSGSELSRQRNLFNNSEHLNAIGADLFSQDLGRRLVQEIPQLMATEPVALPVSQKRTAP